MIGQLPVALNINGKEFAIRSDYRVALLIYQAQNEPDYTDEEKTSVALACLYEHPEDITAEDLQDAIKQMTWFLDGGEVSETPTRIHAKKIMDWEQDEQLIFSAVNKVAGKEIREVEYLHWWTFLGYFRERGECLLNTIINIRDKMNKGKKLDKDEKEFLTQNPDMVKLKIRMTAAEKAEREYYERLLSGKEKDN